MKLSTRTRYGVRAMLELALNDSTQPVSLGVIAERQNISRKYLHAILSDLKRAGLVKSVYGAQGGFTLARSTTDIWMSEIVKILEGSLMLVECKTGNSSCERLSSCASSEVWGRLNDAIENVLKDISLSDLVKQHKEKDRPPMYYI